ncbi:MAG: methylated-DNA--[protein]-cysteine S-methyltransferase [Myxococcota bacterium]
MSAVPQRSSGLQVRVLSSALGPIRIVAKDNAIKKIAFVQKSDAALGEPNADGSPLVDRAASQVESYLAGERKGFDLPLAPEGSDHDQKVWRLLQSIPYGTTQSYGEIAQAMNAPGSARAVGLASGRNPIAIVIPCHRVIGANGKLTGYAGGVQIKAQLLDLERMGLIPR